MIANSRSSLATRGLVALVGIAAAVALAGCSPAAEPDPDPQPTEVVDTDAFAIVIGDCFNDPGAGDVETIPKIDCEKPHGNEAFGSTSIPDGDFPDKATIDALGSADCVEQFANFVGIAANESKYSIGYFFPTEESWDQGDREILCYVFDEAGPITGTLLGRAE